MAYGGDDRDKLKNLISKCWRDTNERMCCSSQKKVWVHRSEFTIMKGRLMSDSCLEPDHNFDYFDSDDIDSFEFDRLSEQIKEAEEDLRCCDPEHVAWIKKDLADLRAELEDVKAGV